MSAVTRRLVRGRGYQIEDARRDHVRAAAQHGEDHPAARAALGRLWFYLGRVPQVGLASIEAIAWARESGGMQRPRWNRSQRRHTDHKDRCPVDTGLALPTPEDHHVAPPIPTFESARGAQ
jgi:hypothetical protein